MTLDISLGILVPSCSSRHLVNDIDDGECLHLVPDAGEMAAVATTTVHVEAMQDPSPHAAVCVLLNNQMRSVVSARRQSCTDRCCTCEDVEIVNVVVLHSKLLRCTRNLQRYNFTQRVDVGR